MPAKAATAPTRSATDYDGDSIVALEGLEPVRKRPGMYIGGTGIDGLHHICWEIFDNAIDEAMNGHASEISLKLHADGTTITVTDNGRGIPIDRNKKTKKSGVEMVFTMLHAGGKFDPGAYTASGGLHGVGAAVTNALSKSLTASVRRGGHEHTISFARGAVTKPLKKSGAARGSGTVVTFTPDPQIFPRTAYTVDRLRNRCETASFLHRGLKINFVDDTNSTREVFQHENGIRDYLAHLIKTQKQTPVHPEPYVNDRTDSGVRVECVLQWTEATSELVQSYANGIHTSYGGTHENGLRAGLTRALKNYVETHNLLPRGVKLATEDFREGLFALVSVFLGEPQFQSQTKDRLNNTEMQAIVDAAVRQPLEGWLNANPSTAQAIVARVIAAARAREASRAAAATVSRKSATSNRLTLPGKLSDCHASARADTELFIVEGDSAGGSAKQGRDRNTQAILPLRGKVLNTEGVSLKRLLENKELSDLLTAMGCGMGREFDLSKLRYHRIILLADADSDGHHITTLLLTFFYRHLPELIRAGRVFVAVPPLYRVDIGKETYWAATESHRDRLIESHGKAKNGGQAKIEITRFKGLGEMPAKTLWDTTLNPKTRRLLRVQIDDALATDRVMSDLMGKDASARFRFIMERAEDAQELDV